MQHRPLAVLTAALALALMVPVLVPAGGPALISRARAADPQPKVVVVVGPTHGLTASDLQWGAAIAQDAAAHGAQVVQVFHPNATWSEVAAAAAGANVLVYLGHGNGYPSPYTMSLMPDRQDGMGLDPVDGAADDQVQYYGEQYMATLRLAPDALVLLNHLCYASGNSEPGQPEPTQAVAIQRVDNFAAGFLAAGAGAVIALGTQDAGEIVDSLFGPAQSLDQLFTTTGGIGVAPILVPSVRTAGAQLHLDPDSATAGFYRSLAGNLGLLTTAVLGGTAPALGGTAPGPMPSTSPGGAAPGPVTSGMTPPGATPAPPLQSAPEPTLASLAAPSVFTPNGDGISDTLPVTYSMTTPGSLQVSVTAASGGIVRHLVLSDMPAAGRFAWDGRGDDGVVVPDGGYALVVSPIRAGGTFGPAMTVRTRVLTAIKAPGAAPTVFDPLDFAAAANGTTLSMTTTQPATVTWTVTDSAGRVVRTLWSTRSTPAGVWALSWDGTGTLPGSGQIGVLPAGLYRSTITATTPAGTLLMRSNVWLMPFRVTASPAVTSAGHLVSVLVVSAGPLQGAPRLYVTQAGLAPWPVALRPAGGNNYRATFRLRAGQAGTVGLLVVGTSSSGRPLSMAGAIRVQ
ncbi:MAG: FlgD immunoglobulin-like domain containing protein [Candidatus Limnocylindrales bacterium]